MLITVIICTIRRDEVIRRVLDCLDRQDYRDLEVLVVRSESEKTDPTRKPVLPQTLRARELFAAKGLAKARNAGMRQAKGELLCFLDDDVTFDSHFFAKVAALFSSADFQNVGGLTAYDTRNYPAEVSARWRMRRLLRITPSLTPGDANHLGRNVPLAFLEPFSGWKDVKWLPGFCQIYRKQAVEGLSYDEEAAAEDRDFSMEVNRRWRLVICGDLPLAHHHDRQGRYRHAADVRRASFALGRCFAKRRRSWRDWPFIIGTIAGEVLVDSLILAAKPSWENCKSPFVRAEGFFGGLASVKRFP